MPKKKTKQENQKGFDPKNRLVELVLEDGKFHVEKKQSGFKSKPTTWAKAKRIFNEQIHSSQN